MHELEDTPVNDGIVAVAIGLAVVAFAAGAGLLGALAAHGGPELGFLVVLGVLAGCSAVVIWASK